MRRLVILISLVLLLAVIMFLSGCSREKDPKEISIGYVNWSEGIAMSYLAKAMLEEQGYKVTLKNADIAPIFTSVAAGNTATGWKQSVCRSTMPAWVWLSLPT